MFKIAFRYLFYRLFSPHRKGYGIHSPFVFRLVTEVLKKTDDENLINIKEWRKTLKKNKSVLNTINSGAGSKTHRTSKRRVSRIVSSSSIHHKYGRVLYYLAREFNASAMIELGTGIGISTRYLASARAESKCRIISIESDLEKHTFACAIPQLKNAELKHGFFRELLPEALEKVPHPFLVFVDGDHSYEGTLEYFNLIRDVADSATIIVFDDIRWSEQMEKAWAAIKSDPKVKITVDLFFMGIVFFRDGVPKQDFVINF